MSYKALYRTYRPTKFNEVIGQNHIISTLQNIIANDKIGHAYLFAGPRGTGKTSVAHIFARAVNVNASGEEVFGDMDIIEIDAASNNGVSEVRTIIDNVNYAPNKAKYKVYIIDEVHMLTKGAFNALLKTLEEPPTNVIFILATTEPHKIPITILSRTQRFSFKRIDDKSISKQVESILIKENIKFDEESIKFIAKLAQGGMRDALSIADQSSSFGNGIINFEAISQVFGIISTENQINLLNQAYKGNAKELMVVTTRFLDNGVDIEKVSSSLLEIVKDFIIFKKTKDLNLMSFLTEDEVKLIELDVDYAYEIVEILMDLITKLRLTSVPRQSFELSILKMVNDKSVELITKEEVETPKTFTQEIKTDENQKIKIIEQETLIEIKTEKVFQEEKLITKEERLIAKTQNINMNILKEEVEAPSKMDKITNDILTTQEIPVGEINKTQNTDEIDITELFESEKTIQESQSIGIESRFTIDEILNLLVQSNRETLIKMKSNWEILLKTQETYSNKHFMEIIRNIKIISSGENFILVSSSEKEIINRVNAERLNDNFLEFLEKGLGRRVLLYAITKEEFGIVKESWSKLYTTNSLPKPKEIILPIPQEKIKTKEEDYGTSLFGDLFSS